MKKLFFFMFVTVVLALTAFFSCTSGTKGQREINTSASNGINPVNLRIEYLKNPLGIDVIEPRLSWQLQSKQRGQKQTAYRVIVASSPDKLSENIGDL